MRTHLQQHPSEMICLLFVAISISFVGCQTAPPSPDTTTVSASLSSRMGHEVAATSPFEPFTLPPGVILEDGITEEEAIVSALWNNAAFQELLLDLGVARGDLITAGLLPNPEFQFTFSVPDKPFRYLIEFPIEAVYLRPIRVESAKHDAYAAGERLSQAGLILIRDVRQAYANLVLAKEQLRIAEQGVALRGRIAELAEIRLDVGEISEQEAATARIDALQAKQNVVPIAYNVPIAEELLRNFMGIGPFRGPLPLMSSETPTCMEFDVNALTDTAMTSRPDALSSAQTVAAAQARLRFQKIGWVRFLGILDATAGMRTGHEFGPGLRFTVPIFNQNQGNIARAEAELERALRNQKSVANQIILEVQQSYLQYRQACAELEVLRTDVRPEVEELITRAQASYKEGDVPIFIALTATQQLLDSYTREATLNANLRLMWVELERSVGQRLAPPSPLLTAEEQARRKANVVLTPPTPDAENKPADEGKTP